MVERQKQFGFLLNIVLDPNINIQFGSMMHPKLLSILFRIKQLMVYLDSGNVYTSFFLGVNETAKIGVAGDSAGGMISASLSHTIKGIDFQV